MSKATRTTDVAIIGGGIIGVSLAEALAREGMGVIVAERGPIGREASWAAAGMLAPQSEMPEPGPYFDLCLTARRMYPATVDRVRQSSAIDPQYRDDGMLYVAFSEREEKTLRERAAWQCAAGVRADVLLPEQARALVPGLTDDFRMAVHFAEDHQLDPRLMTRGFAIAARRLGVQLMEYSPVASILTRGERAIGIELAGEKIHAGAIVLAGGCWSGLLAGLGVALPTYPVKGQLLLLEAEAGLFAHTLHSARVYLVPRFDGRIIVGASEEHDAGFDKSVRAGTISELLSATYEVHPSLTDALLVDTWAGLRPGTPDRRPILGPCSIENLILATGHFRNGILLAPLTAKLLTEFMTSDKLPSELDAFSIRRFPARANPQVAPNV